MYDNLDIMATGNLDNLVPSLERTPEERREIAIRAGKQSGIVRQKKREVTDIYGHWLATKHDIKLDGEMQSISGYALVNRVMGEIIAKGDKSSVMMIAEIRKAREGTTYHIDNGAVDADLQETSAEVLKAEFEAELAKRDKILQARKAGETVVPEDTAPGQEIAYEVEKPEEAAPMAQEATVEPARPEVLKGDDTIQP